MTVDMSSKPLVEADGALAGRSDNRALSDFSVHLPVFEGPQDGIEPMRRMCKWIIEESRDEDHLRRALLVEQGEMA